MISALLALVTIISYLIFTYAITKHLQKTRLSNWNRDKRVERAFNVNEMIRIKTRNYDKYDMLYDGLKESHKNKKSF